MTVPGAMLVRTALVAVATVVVTGCTTTAVVEEEDAGTDGVCASTVGAEFPDVVGASLEAAGDGAYRVDATLCSAYDTADRYADAWRVTTRDGAVLGVRELLHDHAGEQPFTRSLSGVEIPAGVDTVVVEGRDLVNGWGGETVEVPLP